MGLLLLMGNSFSGALDSLGTGLESAWSVGRRLRAAYSGPIIRVRRSSDNAEQDFSGSGATGAVDTAAVAAFCGAGDGFLTTIYGQSGLSRNLTQSTTTLQPQVVSSGTAITVNGRLAAEFDGATSSRRMAVASSTATYNFLHNGTSSTLYSVISGDDTAAVKVFLSTQLSGSNNQGVTLYLTASETLLITVGSGTADVVNVTKTGAITTNLLTVFLDADNATAGDRESAWRDGSLMATDNAQVNAATTNNAASNLTIGIRGTGLPFDGRWCEMVLWSQDVTANRTIWEANAKQFWGTP